MRKSNVVFFLTFGFLLFSNSSFACNPSDVVRSLTEAYKFGSTGTSRPDPEVLRNLALLGGSCENTFFFNFDSPKTEEFLDYIEDTVKISKLNFIDMLPASTERKEKWKKKLKKQLVKKVKEAELLFSFEINDLTYTDPQGVDYKILFDSNNRPVGLVKTSLNLDRPEAEDVQKVKGQSQQRLTVAGSFTEVKRNLLMQLLKGEDGLEVINNLKKVKNYKVTYKKSKGLSSVNGDFEFRFETGEATIDVGSQYCGDGISLCMNFSGNYAKDLYSGEESSGGRFGAYTGSDRALYAFEASSFLNQENKRNTSFRVSQRTPTSWLGFTGTKSDTEGTYFTIDGGIKKEN